MKHWMTSVELASREQLPEGWIFILPDDDVKQAFDQLTADYLSDMSQYPEQLGLLHERLAEYVRSQGHVIDDPVNDLLIEVGWLVEEEGHISPEYVRAQLSGFAHLFGWNMGRLTCQAKGWAPHLVDPRDIFTTDDQWLNGQIDAEYLAERLPRLNQRTLITAGHIGGTTMNEMTIISNRQAYDLIP